MNILFYTRSQEVSGLLLNVIQELKQIDDLELIRIANCETGLVEGVECVESFVPLDSLFVGIDIVIVVTNQVYGLVNKALDACKYGKTILLPKKTFKSFSEDFPIEGIYCYGTLRDLPKFIKERSLPFEKVKCSELNEILKSIELENMYNIIAVFK